MRSDQAAQGLIQSGLENFQGWRQHDFFGQSVPNEIELQIELTYFGYTSEKDTYSLIFRNMQS